MEEYKLFDAEYRLMELVWRPGAGELHRPGPPVRGGAGVEKVHGVQPHPQAGRAGVPENEHATVTALVKREQVRQYESAAVVERGFGGSLPAFVAAFLREKKLSPQEADELRRMLDESEGGHD